MTDKAVCECLECEIGFAKAMRDCPACGWPLRQAGKRQRPQRPNWDALFAAIRRDEERVGTREFIGVTYFHNLAYKHLLRSAGDYQECMGLKTAPRNWRQRYRRIHHMLLDAGLDVSGHSPEHTAIIEKALRLKAGSLACFNED